MRYFSICNWLLLPIIATFSTILAAQNPLALWQDGAAKEQIIKLVHRVTTPMQPEFLPPAFRIAVLDGDSVLWQDTPTNIDTFFALAHLHHFKNTLPLGLSAEEIKQLQLNPAEILTRLTPIERRQLLTYFRQKTEQSAIQKKMQTWVSTQRHPTLRCRYDKIAYPAMMTLISYLREAQFTVYIVNGCESDAVQILAESNFKLPAQNIITDQPNRSAIRYQADTIDRTHAVNPLTIERAIAMQPILAIGGSDAFLPILQFTATNTPGLAMVMTNKDDKKLSASASKAHWLTFSATDFITPANKPCL